MLNASVAITSATGALVGAASNAQTERLKLIDLGLAPQRDDVWTDALLNAAKTVANSVNDLSNGTIFSFAVFLLLTIQLLLVQHEEILMRMLWFQLLVMLLLLLPN